MAVFGPGDSIVNQGVTVKNEASQAAPTGACPSLVTFRRPEFGLNGLINSLFGGEWLLHMRPSTTQSAYMLS